MDIPQHLHWTLAEIESLNMHIVPPDEAAFFGETPAQPRPRLSAVTKKLMRERLASNRIPSVVHILPCQTQSLQQAGFGFVDSTVTLLNTLGFADGGQVAHTHTDLKLWIDGQTKYIHTEICTSKNLVNLVVQTHLDSTKTFEAAEAQLILSAIAAVKHNKDYCSYELGIIDHVTDRIITFPGIVMKGRIPVLYKVEVSYELLTHLCRRSPPPERLMPLYITRFTPTEDSNEDVAVLKYLEAFKKFINP